MMNPPPYVSRTSTFSTPFSSQHRSLDVLDILHTIFSFVDGRTAKLCSSVCRTWREPALAAFWRYLDNDGDFGGVLLPHLVPKKIGCNCGQWYTTRIHLHHGESPSNEDWQRYSNQARRIRSIRISPFKITKQVSEEVLELLASKPAALPLLRHVLLKLCEARCLESPMDLVKIFLHDNIQELTLDFDGFDEEIMSLYSDDLLASPEVRTACRLLQKIPTVATRVTRVTINMQNYMLMFAFGKSIGNALSLFNDLTELTASSCGVLKPSMVIALKDLPSLRTVLSTDQRDRLACQPRHPTLRRKDPARSNRFPSLEFLHLYGSLAAMSTAFGDGWGQFSSLTYLRLCVPCDHTLPSDVIDFLSTPCERLVDLTIVFLEPQPGNIGTTVPMNRTNSGRMLYLKTLKVYRNGWSNDHVVDLIERLPQLESLRIGPHVSGEVFVSDVDLDSDKNDYFLDSDVVQDADQMRLRGVDYEYSDMLSLNVLERLTYVANNLREITILAQQLIADEMCQDVPVGPYLRKLRKVTTQLILEDEESVLLTAELLASVLPPKCGFKALNLVGKRPTYTWRCVRRHVQLIRLGLYDDELI